ncbi:MAG: hypothetical protein JJU28_05310 [Cyclobacteriaceae bacterium]|nr:hypothetical protein [Cyclobacteriaceae bacterium]
MAVIKQNYIIIILLVILGCSNDQTLLIKNENIEVRIYKDGLKLEFKDATGKDYLVRHTEAGLNFGIGDSSPSGEVKVLNIIDKTNNSITLLAENNVKEQLIVNYTLFNNSVRIKAGFKDQQDKGIIDVKTAPSYPAYGLGDHGSYGSSTNIFGIQNDSLINKPWLRYNANHFRFVSNFSVFPSQKFAQVLFENGLKRISIDSAENRMGAANVNEITAYYFFGDIKQIYYSYKQAKEREEYKDYLPKPEFFELGYEAFGSLGWNTNQQSVTEDLKKYLALSYPIKWAVIGSGFWKGERRSPLEGSTTSFGMWDNEFEPGRNDGFPNPRYPDVEGLKNFFKSNQIKFLIGLRTNFKALPDNGGYYNESNDGLYTIEGLHKGYFIKDTSNVAQTYKVNFPQGKVHLLETNNKEALEWYYNGFRKWDVDGYKEDLMFHDGVRLNNDAKVNKMNELMMENGEMVMVRNAAFSVPGDILRLEDTKYGFNQDRTLINALSYAASGVGNIYPDIVAGKYLKNPLTEDEKLYFVRNAVFGALAPSMAMGHGPWHLLNEKYERTVKKAVDFFDMLVPYKYSEIIKGYNEGFPFAFTPLPIAFPEDSNTYNLADTTHRQYSWMIGESLLAVPLFGNDYANSDTRNIYLPEGKWMDFETFEVFNGPVFLKDYQLPLDKIPVFIGGKGIFICRENERLYAVFYPGIPDKQTEYLFYHSPTMQSSFNISEIQNKDNVKVRENTSGEVISFEKINGNGIKFNIEPGGNYVIYE